MVPAIVEKALGSARTGTKRKGMDLCAMFVEVENGGEGVMVSLVVSLVENINRLTTLFSQCRTMFCKVLVRSFPKRWPVR